MNIEKIKEMSHNELLDLYTLMVKTDHYDPFKTPDKVVEMNNAGIYTHDVEEIVLERMKSSNFYA